MLWRRWLRGESLDPVREVDEALNLVTGLCVIPSGKGDVSGTTIVAFRTSKDIDALIPVLQRLGGEVPTT
jgi:hypothetical protein